MSRIVSTLTLTMLVCFASIASGDEVSKTEMRSLDEQVQEIKTDVLGIAGELNLLEERLLFPSNTQLAIFVAIERDAPIRLDAVRIELDGQLASHHIYSFKELEALQKGGVQRIYAGNVSTGEHELRVIALGKLPNGNDFSWTESFSFRKEVEPRLLGVALAGPDSGKASIELEDW